MKLLSIANRYYLLTLVIVFLIGSTAAYYILKSIINREFNQKLFAEKEQLIYELHTYEDLQDNYYLNIGDIIELEEVASDPQIEPYLRDTTMYHPYEKREMPFRMLTFSDRFNGRFYRVTITKSLLPNQDLIEGVSEIMLGLITVLALSLGLLNRYIFQKLWQPFYQILGQLKSFNITKPQPVAFQETRVEEFKELETAIDKMINKSIRDYKTLKEFTENTSHEIQTPLAIIRSKAENLLQEPLPEANLTDIGKIYEAAGRLSRLKEGLLTISRIENKLYVEQEPLHLRGFLEERLEAFRELIELKELETETGFAAAPVLRMNSDLAFILFSNLLSNAIKHNIQGGKIAVQLENNRFRIANTGPAPDVPTEELFDRFKRSGRQKDSTGLGLSLVKRIAELYEMTVRYEFREGWHELTLVWGTGKKPALVERA